MHTCGTARARSRGRIWPWAEAPARRAGCLATFALLIAHALTQPAQAQAESPVQLMAGFRSACGEGVVCPPLGDPLARNGFVLRLRAVQRVAGWGALAGADSMEFGSPAFAERMARLRADAAKDPAARLSRGAGEAHAGRFAAALPLLQQAQEMSVAGADLGVEAASLNNLGVVTAMLGRYDEARLRFDEALKAYSRLAAEPRLPPGTAKPSFGNLPIPAAKQEEAWAEIRKRILELEAQEARRGRWVVLLNMGSLAAHLGLFPEAETRLGEAVALAKASAESGAQRISLGEMAQLYRKTGQSDKAAEYRRRAQAARRNDEDARDEERRDSLLTSEVALVDPGATATPPPAPPNVDASRPGRGEAAPPADAEPGPAMNPRRAAAAQRLQERLEKVMRSGGEARIAQINALFVACDGGRCNRPAEPSQRRGHLLRLAGVWRIPNLGVAPGGLPMGWGPGSPPFLVAGGVNRAAKGALAEAQAEWQKALQASAGGLDRQSEAAALSNLGVAAALQGRDDEARSRMKAALDAYGEIVKAAQSRPRLDHTLPMTGPQAMASMQAAAGLMENGSATAGRLLVALNLAHLEAHLGRAAAADTWLKTAYENAVRDGHGTRLVLGETALIDRIRGRMDAAADQARRAAAGTDLAEIWVQIEVGFIPLGAAEASAAASPQAPAVAAAPAAQPATTEASDSRALQAAASEAQHARLAAEAGERERAGDLAGAMALLGRAALVAAAAGNAERERAALASLQRLHAARGDAEAAIYYGKRSVNAIQRIRQSLAQLDRASRQAFLAEKKQTYVLLAQGLMARNRLPEAEHVLRLLKEDEGQQLQESSRRRGAVPYSARESTSLQDFERQTSRLRPLDERRARLAGGLQVDGPLDSRAAIESARLKNLNRTDQTLSTFEVSIASGTDETLARCRRLSAKPAASRSAAELGQLAECSTALRAVSATLDEGAAAMRTLKADAARFLTPPDGAAQRQMDALLLRAASLKAKLAPVLALVRDQPAPAGGQAATTQDLAGMLLLDTGRLHDLWLLQIEIDGLLDQFSTQEARIGSALAQAGEPEFAPADRAVLDTGLRLMKALPPGSAALYYLGGEQWVDILMVSADGWSKARGNVARVALEQKIDAFRRLVSAPKDDPVPLARDLYGLLVEPIEPQLKAARATTLMIALEGPLRYLPFAALHDGQGWLAQRFATSLYTTAAPTALTTQPAPAWEVAAFGSAAGGAGLPPLPAVRQELQAIVRDPAQPARGVLPGSMRLDRDFTAQALRDALRARPKVVHIASHFAFRSDDAGASFLLLGDGGRLTLSQLGSADFRFDQVELVTLSACETALVAGNSFGQEVEALGTLLQAQGAGAVLSTLWRVADDSTARFMRRFYESRERGADGAARLSRAQALRAAQLAFIRPAAAGTEARPAPARAAANARSGSFGDERSFLVDPARPYAHPFFWAPFVLMGNWL